MLAPEDHPFRDLPSKSIRKLCSRLRAYSLRKNEPLCAPYFFDAWRFRSNPPLPLYVVYYGLLALHNYQNRNNGHTFVFPVSNYDRLVIPGLRARKTVYLCIRDNGTFMPIKV